MLTFDDIRTYVKDHEEFNVLLDGHLQSYDALIELAMRLTVSYANMVPPVTEYTTETFPCDAAMLYGVLHHLANGEAERQLRNNINFNAQGLATNLDDKFGQYNQLATYYRQLFEREIAQFKQYKNQEDAWGGNWSPYAKLPYWEFRD